MIICSEDETDDKKSDWSNILQQTQEKIGWKYQKFEALQVRRLVNFYPHKKRSILYYPLAIKDY